jgi:uncharacterized protein (TIGR00661 family)
MSTRFLFIVQTEGRGHMSQAIALKEQMEVAGNEVVAVLVGKGTKQIPEYFQNEFQNKIITYKTAGFAYDNQNKGLNLFRSFVKNLLAIPIYIRSIILIRRQLQRYEPQVVVNFYEPLGALAHLFLTKSHLNIVVAHHFYLTHPDFEMVVGHHLEKFLLKVLNKIVYLRADKILALSFRPAKIKHSKVTVVNPLLRKQILQAKPTRQDYILAYSVNCGYAEELKAWQAKHPDQLVHYFSDRPQNEACVEIQPNLFFHKLDQKLFMNYMVNCSGIACSAGFESVCEAMYLQKPIMLVPTAHHFEQLCNAKDASMQAGCSVNDTFGLDQLQVMISAAKALEANTWLGNNSIEIYLKPKLRNRKNL